MDEQKTWKSTRIAKTKSFIKELDTKEGDKLCELYEEVLQVSSNCDILTLYTMTKTRANRKSKKAYGAVAEISLACFLTYLRIKREKIGEVTDWWGPKEQIEGDLHEFVVTMYKVLPIDIHMPDVFKAFMKLLDENRDIFPSFLSIFVTFWLVLLYTPETVLGHLRTMSPESLEMDDDVFLTQLLSKCAELTNTKMMCTSYVVNLCKRYIIYWDCHVFIFKNLLTDCLLLDSATMPTIHQPTINFYSSWIFNHLQQHFPNIKNDLVDEVQNDPISILVGLQYTSEDFSGIAQQSSNAKDFVNRLRSIAIKKTPPSKNTIRDPDLLPAQSAEDLLTLTTEEKEELESSQIQWRNEANLPTHRVEELLSVSSTMALVWIHACFYFKSSDKEIPDFVKDGTLKVFNSCAEILKFSKPTSQKSQVKKTSLHWDHTETFNHEILRKMVEAALQLLGGEQSAISTHSIEETFYLGQMRKIKDVAEKWDLQDKELLNEINGYRSANKLTQGQQTDQKDETNESKEKKKIRLSKLVAPLFVDSAKWATTIQEEVAYYIEKGKAVIVETKFVEDKKMLQNIFDQYSFIVQETNDTSSPILSLKIGTVTFVQSICRIKIQDASESEIHVIISHLPETRSEWEMLKCKVQLSPPETSFRIFVNTNSLPLETAWSSRRTFWGRDHDNIEEPAAEPEVNYDHYRQESCENRLLDCMAWRHECNATALMDYLCEAKSILNGSSSNTYADLLSSFDKTMTADKTSKITEVFYKELSKDAKLGAQPRKSVDYQKELTWVLNEMIVEKPMLTGKEFLDFVKEKKNNGRNHMDEIVVCKNGFGNHARNIGLLLQFDKTSYTEIDIFVFYYDKNGNLEENLNNLSHSSMINLWRKYKNDDEVVDYMESSLSELQALSDVLQDFPEIRNALKNLTV